MEGILPGRDIYEHILWTKDRWQEAGVGNNLSSRQARSLKVCLQKLACQHIALWEKIKARSTKKALLHTVKLRDVT